MAAVESEHKYSPFQRRVIKALPKLVGNRGYNYDLCSNNHMQIFIQGVDKPIHCSSTPSDSRAFANVNGDIKRSIKEAECNAGAEKVVDGAGDAVENEAGDINESHLNKAYGYVVRLFRKHIELIKEDEVNAVSSSPSFNLDDLVTMREEFLVEAVAKWYEQNGLDNDFFDSESINSLYRSLIEHMHFCLPTKAYYAQLMRQLRVQRDPEAKDDKKDIIQRKIASAVTKALETLQRDGFDFGSVKIDVEIDLDKFTHTFADSAEPPALTVRQHFTHALEKASTQAELTAEFKQLEPSELDLLIAAGEAAKAEQKTEADMKDVIRMMEEKGLRLEQIAAYLGVK